MVVRSLWHAKECFVPCFDSNDLWATAPKGRYYGISRKTVKGETIGFSKKTTHIVPAQKSKLLLEVKQLFVQFDLVIQVCCEYLEILLFEFKRHQGGSWYLDQSQPNR